jgi:hypothetical protein
MGVVVPDADDETAPPVGGADVGEVLGEEVQPAATATSRTAMARSFMGASVDRLPDP